MLCREQRFSPSLVPLRHSSNERFAGNLIICNSCPPHSQCKSQIDWFPNIIAIKRDWSCLSSQVLNASSNFLIYLFVGVSFRSKFVEIFRIPKCCIITADFVSKKESSPNIRSSQVLRRYVGCCIFLWSNSNAQTSPTQNVLLNFLHV